MIAGIHAVGADRARGGEFCQRVEALRSQGARLVLAATGLPQQVFGLAALTPARMWIGSGPAGFAQAACGEDREAVLSETAQKIASVGGAQAVLIRASALGESDDRTGLIPLEEAAKERGCPAEELVFEIICECPDASGAVLQTDDCDFAAQLFSKPFVSLCTDGQLLGVVDYTLPHFLGNYVRGRGILTLEDAVHRCTMAQADFFGLWDRGLIREGMSADLALLQPNRFPDRIGPEMTRGVVKVWVGGDLRYNSDPRFDVNQLSKPKFFGIQMEA